MTQFINDRNLQNYARERINVLLDRVGICTTSWACNNGTAKIYTQLTSFLQQVQSVLLK